MMLWKKETGRCYSSLQLSRIVFQLSFAVVVRMIKACVVDVNTVS